MKKNNVTFAIVAVVLVIAGLAIFNFSNDQNKTKSESIQKAVINGTVTENSTTRETITDDDGSQTQQTNTKITVDPEGLMNKKTIEDSTQTQSTP